MDRREGRQTDRIDKYTRHPRALHGLADAADDDATILRGPRAAAAWQGTHDGWDPHTDAESYRSLENKQDATSSLRRFPS